MHEPLRRAASAPRELCGQIVQSFSESKLRQEVCGGSIVSVAVAKSVHFQTHSDILQCSKTFMQVVRLKDESKTPPHGIERFDGSAM